MKRQTDDFLAGLLGYRKGIVCAGQVFKNLLLVQRAAVVNGAGDCGGFESFG